MVTTTRTFDTESTLTACREVSERLITLVEQSHDLGARVSPRWDLADALAHVATVIPRYRRGAEGQLEVTDTPGEVAAYNAREIAALNTRDLGQLTAAIRTSVTEVADLIPTLGEHPPTWTFHGGSEVRADVATGVLLGELVVHGRDIATALGQPWPIDPYHVELIHQGLDQILPGWLSDRARGHTGSYEVRLRGQGTHRFDFRHGVLRINPPGQWRPDVILSADPAAYLLVVYKRASQWPNIARGRLVAYGRKPWLAFSFAARFHQP